MKTLNPLLHTLFALVFITFLATISFYDFWGLLNPVGLLRMRNDMSNIQTHTLTSISSRAYNYLDHMFVILLPPFSQLEMHQGY